MTATLISLISIVIGIIGANLLGLFYKKYSFGLAGNTIAGVFGCIISIKFFGQNTMKIPTIEGSQPVFGFGCNQRFDNCFLFF